MLLKILQSKGNFEKTRPFPKPELHSAFPKNCTLELIKVMAHTQLIQTSTEKTCYPDFCPQSQPNWPCQRAPALDSSSLHCRGQLLVGTPTPHTASSLSGHTLGGQSQSQIQAHHGTHHSAEVDRACPQGTVCGWVDLEVQALV